MSPPKTVTKEVVITRLQQLPTDVKINKKSLFNFYNEGELGFHPSAIPVLFGSIKNACEEAGVRCDALYGKEHIQHMQQLNVKYTKENLIQLLQESFKKYGKMTPTDFVLKINEDNNVDVRGAIKKFFGSVEKALIEAGVEYNNYYWTNERIVKALHDLNEKYGPLYKVQIHEFHRKGLICGAKCIKDRFKSMDFAAAIAGFRFVEPYSVGKQNGGIGHTETKTLNDLEFLYGIKILRSYKILIDSIYYVVDGYDPVYNVVYEVDEAYHKHPKQQMLDRLREEKIINVLHCQFIRIKNY